MDRIVLRTLSPRDMLGMLRVLSVFNAADEVPPAEHRRGHLYYRTTLVLVLVGDDLSETVTATGTIHVIHKDIHGGCLTGFIEDVAVLPEQQGKGYGKQIVRALIADAQNRGCYKCVLTCADHNVGYYESLGFRRHENAMRIDLKPYVYAQSRVSLSQPLTAVPAARRGIAGAAYDAQVLDCRLQQTGQGWAEPLEESEASDVRPTVVEQTGPGDFSVARRIVNTYLHGKDLDRELKYIQSREEAAKNAQG